MPLAPQANGNLYLDDGNSSSRVAPAYARELSRSEKSFMETLSLVLRYEMLLLLSVLIVILTYKMLVQEINTNGLLLDKTSARAFSPGGLQMLVVTLTIAVYYMFMVFDAQG